MGSIYTDNDRASKKLHFDIPGVGAPEKIAISNCTYVKNWGFG